MHKSSIDAMRDAVRRRGVRVTERLELLQLLDQDSRGGALAEFVARILDEEIQRCERSAAAIEREIR